MSASPSRQPSVKQGVVKMDVKVPIFRDREAGDYSCGLDFFSCYAQGDTPEEAIQNLLGTVHYTLDLYEKEGLTLPADYQPEDPEGPDVVSVVTLPIDVPQGLLAGGMVRLLSPGAPASTKPSSHESDALAKPCESSQ